MFLKNKKGELVNIKNVIAVRPFIDNYCPPTIHMYTKGGHKVRFCHASESDAIQAHKAIKELLIHGPKHNQQPWIDVGAKWIDVDGNMFMIDQIDCVLVEGWVVTVHMENTMIEFFNRNDKELEQCLRNFEIALRGVGYLCNSWFDIPNAPGNAESYHFCPGCAQPLDMREEDKYLMPPPCNPKCGYLAIRQEDYDDEPLGYCHACEGVLGKLIGSVDAIHASKAECLIVKKERE